MSLFEANGYPLLGFLSSREALIEFLAKIPHDAAVSIASGIVLFVLGFSWRWVYSELRTHIALKRMFGRERLELSARGLFRWFFPKTEIAIVVPKWWAPESTMLLNDFESSEKKTHLFKGSAEFIAKCDAKAMAEIANALEVRKGIKTNTVTDDPELRNREFLTGKKILIGSNTSNSVVDKTFKWLARPDDFEKLKPRRQAEYMLEMRGNGRASADQLVFRLKDGQVFEADDKYEYACIYKCPKPLSDCEIKHVIIIAGQFGHGTAVAASYFAKHHGRMFKGGRLGVILRIDRSSETDPDPAVEGGRGQVEVELRAQRRRFQLGLLRFPSKAKALEEVPLAVQSLVGKAPESTDSHAAQNNRVSQSL